MRRRVGAELNRVTDTVAMALEAQAALTPSPSTGHGAKGHGSGSRRKPSRTILDVDPSERLYDPMSGLLQKDVTMLSFYNFVPIEDPQEAHHSILEGLFAGPDNAQPMRYDLPSPPHAATYAQSHFLSTYITHPLPHALFPRFFSCSFSL